MAAPATTGEPAARPGAARERFAVVDHNVQKRWPALRTALRLARQSNARAVTLQEVCAWQVARLRRAHPGWTVAWLPVRRTDGCRAPGAAGGRAATGNVAVWTEAPDGTTTTPVFDDQLGSTWHQGLACVTWGDRPFRRVCSTHLLSSSIPRRVRLRARQAADVHRTAAPWTRRGDLVVVAGDLNDAPRSRPLGWLYGPSTGGRGRFREVAPGPAGDDTECRCAVATRDGGARLDYVFFSDNRARRSARHGLRVVRTASDHHALVGWFEVDLRRGSGRS